MKCIAWLIIYWLLSWLIVWWIFDWMIVWSIEGLIDKLTKNLLECLCKYLFVCFIVYFKFHLKSNSQIDFNSIFIYYCIWTEIDLGIWFKYMFFTNFLINKYTIIYKDWIEIDLWIWFKYKFPTTILWLFHNTHNKNLYTGI